MPAAKHNITIEQGATFNLNLTWDMAADPATFTARMQVRAQYTSDTPVISLTSPSSGIVIAGTSGAITIAITIEEEQTRAIAAGKYVYDLELVQGSTVYRLIAGEALVTPEVTR
jgi:hypothetical protein